MLPSHIKALILDMDGVIWRSDSPIGNLAEIFARIEARGLKYVFATNNGTKTPEQYVERLAEFGVHVQPLQVVTSALGVAFMLDASRKYPKGTKIFMIGEDGVRVALERYGVVRYNGSSATVDLRQEGAVPEMAAEIVASGGRLEALIPHRESLEDMFVRVVESSTEGEGA